MTLWLLQLKSILAQPLVPMWTLVSALLKFAVHDHRDRMAKFALRDPLKIT